MAITGKIERGSIVWCDLHPAKGREQHGYRASIIISDGFIDETLNKMAVTVPVTTQKMGHSFEIEVPQGIKTPHSHLLPHAHLHFNELQGVVLTNNVRSIDLHARNAIVIGKIDTESHFFYDVVDHVLAILAYPEEDE